MNKSLPQFFANLFTIPDRGNRYAAMEGLRAYAVLAVFLVHSLGAYSRVLEKTSLNKVRMGQLDNFPDMLQYYFFRSHYGVDIFFLLSGFLIYRMIARRNFSYRHFMFNRVMRIYPAFLLSLGLAIAVKLLLNPAFTLQAKVLLQNLLFLNGIPGMRSIVAYNHPTWSLFFEFTFYLALPVLVYGLRINSAWRIVMLAVVWFLLCQFVHPHYSRYFMFLAGAMLATASDSELKRMAALIPDFAVLLLYLCSTLYFVYELGLRRFIPVYALTTSLLFVNAVYGHGFLNRVFSLKTLRYLGNISYSFYLVHATAIGMTFKLMVKPQDLTAGLPALTLLLLCSFTLSILLAVLIFSLVEKPYFRRK